MIRLLLMGLVCAAASSHSIAQRQPASTCDGDQWPGFRGAGTGRTHAKHLPREWSAEKNLAWRATLPGYGQSSPVVHGDRVFVTSTEGPEKENCFVCCYRLRDGLMLWSRSYDATHRVRSSNMVSKAAPTPSVDGDRVYAFFESGDLIATTHAGETVWRRSLVGDYGAFQGNHGLSSSPVLSEDALLLLVDHEGPSYLLKMDKKTGQNIWKVDRSPRVSWSTPVLTRCHGRPALLISSNGVVESVDLEAGRTNWQFDGVEGNTVPSPAIHEGYIVVSSSKSSGCVVLRNPTSPDAAKPEVVCRGQGVRPSGFSSPIVMGQRILLTNKSGTLSSVELDTGAVSWTHRLKNPCWASPIVSGELVYLFGQRGTTTVLRPGPDEPEIVSVNELETEQKVYGVAAVDGHFVIREGKTLTCVRQPTE